ncbi:MAG: hypothetical protein LBU40_04500 [Methanobrevibacter sp.]|nr:hypothetical protein [Methanobrevibacter sp.]
MTFKKIKLQIPQKQFKYDKKKLEKIGINEIYERPLNQDFCEFIYRNNKIVANAIKIKKEDIILNNNFYSNSDFNFINNYIIEGLEYNKEEIANIVADHELFGAGCGVIRQYRGYINFQHLKQKNLEVVNYSFNGNYYPLILYNYGNTIEYFKFNDYYYPEDFNYQNKDLESCLWIGGGQFNSFYSYPFYYQAINDITQELINKNYDKTMLENGNLVSGLVYMNKQGVTAIRKNRRPEDETGEAITSTVLPQNIENIKNSIEKAGLGNVFLYEESDNALTIDYVRLTNDNYDYLLKRLEDYRTELMSAALIPQERFMLTNIKESMNSNKTLTIWNIYINSLKSEQNKIVGNFTDCFIILFNYKADININTPIIDEINVLRQKIVEEAFKSGVITLRQYIQQYNDIHQINGEIPDNTNPLLDERYFNFKPIGSAFNDNGGF